MSEESELQIIRKEGESSLTVSPIRSKLVARGRKDMELMLTVRTIKLEDSEEGHFGFKLQWKGTKLSFLAGTHEIAIDIDDAQKLAAFLIKGCTDLVWGSPTPISVGQQWSLHAAREISDEYPQARERDVRRRRVRVQCGNYKWHLLPRELDRLGVLFREALR